MTKISINYIADTHHAVAMLKPDETRLRQKASV